MLYVLVLKYYKMLLLKLPKQNHDRELKVNDKIRIWSIYIFISAIKDNHSIIAFSILSPNTCLSASCKQPCFRCFPPQNSLSQSWSTKNFNILGAAVWRSISNLQTGPLPIQKPWTNNLGRSFFWSDTGLRRVCCHLIRKLCYEFQVT